MVIAGTMHAEAHQQDARDLFGTRAGQPQGGQQNGGQHSERIAKRLKKAGRRTVVLDSSESERSEEGSDPGSLEDFIVNNEQEDQGEDDSNGEI